MPKLQKQPTDTFTRLVEVAWAHGFDWQLFPAGQQAANKAGIDLKDLTPGVMRSAEEACRARLASPMIAINDDPGRPFTVVFDGHPVLDPELNPDHPLPGRAKRERVVADAEATAKASRFTAMREAKVADRVAKGLPSPQPRLPAVPKPPPPPSAPAGKVVVTSVKKLL